ncbi:Glycolipid transfer protein [Myotis brandtii]|uniref:Glycolipid transfer protein n=1 Tax=Myotis brandtii TaxID=109478 RepID=S7NBA7_MYOBR|nr:Glycolipid transfer protein [Myotis brandtii]
MALLAKHLLKPLPANNKIETGPFLEAVSHLPPFFHCLGFPVFTPIKADISGNITKIKAVYNTDPAEFQSISASLDPKMALLAKHLLKPLPAKNKIETGPFLEAVSHLPPFFHCLGFPVFTPIKADINGNIMKIKLMYNTDPAKFPTLQNILEAENEMYGAEWPKVGAMLVLMWLKRGLRFI